MASRGAHFFAEQLQHLQSERRVLAHQLDQPVALDESQFARLHCARGQAVGLV
jgi:hypothetical protein